MRRLYDALGVEISEVGEISHRITLADGKSVSIYLGPKPPLGVVVLKGAQYAIPNRVTQISSFRISQDHESPCFLEITVSAQREISPEQAALLKQEHKETRNALLAEVERDEEKWQHLMDAISGILGLRVHRQLVLEQLVENPFVNGDFPSFSSFAGPAMEVLEGIGVNANTGPHILRLMEDETTTPGDDFVRGGAILHWLLRAWRERDHVSKFMYLFIPLEAILPSNGELAAEAKSDFEALEALVRQSDGQNKDRLISFVERAKSRFSPSLTVRFEELAARIKLSGWELDVQAFKKYNRMRNLLLHRGDRRVRGHINFEENSRTLEDLVERYVAARLLGTTAVYPSRWRPQRQPPSPPAA
jgi:hypothetical protein